MPDKIFTPYTLGCKKCRDEFDLQNNNSFQKSPLIQPNNRNTLDINLINPNNEETKDFNYWVVDKNTGNKIKKINFAGNIRMFIN